MASDVNDVNRGAAGLNAPAPPVYWDGYGLGTGLTGVGVHARSLAAAWPRASVRAGAAPMVIGPTGCAAVFAPFPDWRVVELRDSRLGRLKPFWSRRALAAAKAQRLGQGSSAWIIHGLSNFNVPLGPTPRGLKRVLTVHDLIPLLAPGSVSKALNLQLRVLMPLALDAADQVVCVSHWTKQTLLERFPQHAAKYVVIPNGCDHGASLNQDLNAPLRRESAEVQLLAVGRYEVYKRFDLLLDILRQAPQTWRLRLVTEQKGVIFCQQHGQDLLSSGRLTVASGLDRPALNALYRQSDVLIHPSELEGFCLPAAEAIQAGLPVVYTAGSGIDEVAGTVVATPLQRGTMAAAWVEAVASVVAQSRRAGFRDLVAQEAARLPTWRAAASALVSLYHGLR